VSRYRDPILSILVEEGNRLRMTNTYRINRGLGGISRSPKNHVRIVYGAGDPNITAERTVFSGKQSFGTLYAREH